MIILHTFQTKNGIRPAIGFEECGLDYEVRWVDLYRKEHQAPAFLGVNPEGRIPAAEIIVDGRREILVQSAAILLWTAEETGRFLPSDRAARRAVDTWMFFAMSDLACSSSALNAVETRIGDASEATRAYFAKRFFQQIDILETRLDGREALADEVSVADFALFPVVDFNLRRLQPGVHANTLRWHQAMLARPGLSRALARLEGERARETLA